MISWARQLTTFFRLWRLLRRREQLMQTFLALQRASQWTAKEIDQVSLQILLFRLDPGSATSAIARSGSSGMPSSVTTPGSFSTKPATSPRSVSVSEPSISRESETKPPGDSRGSSGRSQLH